MQVLRRSVSVAPLLAVIVGCFWSAIGQTYDFGALKWRSLGPARGGRSQTSAGSAARPNEYYFGADGGGLWKTTNGGVTWRPVTDGQIHSSSVSAVAVSESNPNIVYIGTGETALRGDIIQGDGMYKSTDAGKTWKHIGLADTQTISRIVIDPTNPELLYVAALGHPYGPNPERGVFRSKDGGTTWSRVLFRDEHSGANDLAMDPHNAKVLYASTWDVYRTPWTLSSGGPGSGLYKSIDGGDTWTDITRNPGLPKGLLGKITVTVSGADTKRVYALVEAEDGGLFASNDAGATWTLVNADRKIRQRAFYFSQILADPNVPNRLYAMNVEFYRSDDGGKTFVTMHTPHPDHHDLWIAPNDSKRMAAADDGGGSVSVDGGETWTKQTYPTAQFYHVITTPQFPYSVCGAQQDSGSICVPSVNSGVGGSYVPANVDSYGISGAEAGYIAVGPKDPNIFFVGDQAGIIWRYDRKANDTHSVSVYPLFFSGMSAGVLPDRWQWTFPIVSSPVDGTVLYTSSQRLFKTTNQGQSWQAISPDLTRNDPKTLGDSGGPITKDQNGPEIYGTIFAIAPSRFDVNTIWVGSDDGLVSLTRDGGKTWKNVTPPEMGEFNRISLMDASPHGPGTLYVAAKRYQLDDRRPYLFKTHDYGKTWTKIVNGIPENDFAQAVREDPVRSGLLYAGTEHGVYLSFDDGAHWQSLALNLPDTQVADLTFADDDLVIGTHGRGFYVLDNIAMLRQLDPGVLKHKVFLFAPSPAIRSVKPATLDYYFTAPTNNVTLEVLDGQGALVRTFKSGTQAKGQENPDVEDGASGGSDTLKGHAGSNRFKWDLRYPGPTLFPGIVLRYANLNEGPYAPPGEYTVRLTADGETSTQKLTILQDPRTTAAGASGPALQFKLAMQIRDATDRANRLVIQIRAVDAQLNKVATNAPGSRAASAAGALRSKLESEEQQLYQVKNRSPRDTLNYPIKLNNQLATLQEMVDEGAEAPTEQEYAVFHQLSGELDAIAAQVDALLENDVNALNASLQGMNAPVVSVPRR